MTRTPARTELFEALCDHVSDLRRDSLKARTLARAYLELCDSLDELPSRGEMHDLAARTLRNYGLACAEQANKLARSNTHEADEIEREGLA